jgi:bacteriorhodopsin
MADVQMNQTDRGGGAAWVWAVVVILLIAVIAWFVFMRGGAPADRTGIDVNIEAPAAPAAPGGGTTAPAPGN